MNGATASEERSAAMPIDLPDRDSLTEPLYLSLAAAIEDAIRKGRLKPGDRLPTHRAVSAQMGLSVHTVSKAYDRLRQQHLIEGHVGRGSYVVDPGAADTAPYPLKRQRDSFYDLAMSRALTELRHDRAMRRTLREMAGNADAAMFLSCRPNLGQEAHRAAGVAWLAGLGLETGAEQVIMTNGATHGAAAALSALTRPGDTVLAAQITNHLVISLCSYLGLTLIGLDSDSEGILPDALDRACRNHDARAVICLPALGNPKGSVMGAARRADIARVAAAHDLHIIENDALGALLEDGPPPIAALAPERTVYLTTFTKCTMPGLRAGYMVAPMHLQPGLLARLLVFSWTATPLICEIATRWVDDGTAARLAAWQRAALAERHRILCQELEGCAVQGQPGGLHYWLHLPEGWSTEGLVARARQLGIVLAPCTPFLTQNAPACDAVRISVGGIADDTDFATALRLLRGLLKTPYEPTPDIGF